MCVKFIPVDRAEPSMFPPGVEDSPTEGHPARFVAEIVEQLGLGSLATTYSGRGSMPHHPSMVAAMPFYGYASVTVSSRKLERAMCGSVAYGYTCTITNPYHYGINSLRKVADATLGKASARGRTRTGMGHCPEGF